MSNNYSFFRGLHKLSGKKFSTLDELLVATGLDFTVSLEDLYFKRKGQEIGQPFKSAIVRDDNDVAVGTGSTIYGVVQYSEWFAACEELINHKGIEVLFGGAPNLGEQAMLVFRQEGEISLGNDKKIVNHFLISSTHDGSGKLTVLSVPMDTHGLVMNVDAPVMAIKHSKKAHDKVFESRQIIEKVGHAWASFEDNVKKLMNVRITEEETRNFIKGVVGEKDSTRSQNIRDKIYDIAKVGISRFYPNCQGTLFGVVLACIEWADNHQTVRASKYCDETTAALNAKLVGDGATKKARAWGVALTMMRNKDKIKLSGAST